MANVSPGYTFTGSTDPITATKLNLLGQPTVTIGTNEVGTDNIASNITINGLTIGANTPFIDSSSTQTFSATISLPIDTSHGTTRIVACTSSTAATINASTGGTSGQMLRFIFSTDGTAGNVITFGTNFKSTGTYTLASTNKYYVINFVSNGTYFIESGRAGPS